MSKAPDIQPDVPTLNSLDTSPFKRLVLSFGAVPSDFKDSMTYYELLAWLCDYLEKQVLPTINQSIEKYDELIEAFNTLKQYVDDYFKNLDVQEEINNKLDVMAEDGTLERLINQEILTDIRQQVGVSLLSLGLVGDGVTDEYQELQDAFDTYDNIYVDDGYNFYSSNAILLHSNHHISGRGKLTCELKAIGEMGDTLTYSAIETNQITFTSAINGDEVIYVYYIDPNSTSNSKRQITKVINANGKLNNNLVNFNDGYTVKKINTLKNITFEDVEIEGRIIFQYCEHIRLNNIKQKNGALRLWYCYDGQVKNSTFEQGVDKYIDCASASSNFLFENLILYGGASSGDNSALKIDEVFYSVINNIHIGASNRVSPYNSVPFSGIMIDGNFAEQGFTRNHSYDIKVSNVSLTKGYTYAVYLTVAKNIKVNNIDAPYNGINVQSYSEDCFIDNCNCDSVIVRGTDCKNIKVSNSKLDHVSDGVIVNTSYVNCYIKTINFKANANDNIFIGCIFDNITNNTNQGVYRNIFKGCVVNQTCSLGGQRNAMIDLILHTNCTLREVKNSQIRLNFVENVNNAETNIAIFGTTLHNIIEYNIDENAMGTTPVSYESVGDIGRYNRISSINLTATTTEDLNFTQGILKANNVPNSGTHKKGEIIFSTVPTAGGNIGWVCTASGTPGTWKTFGAIAS